MRGGVRSLPRAILRLAAGDEEPEPIDPAHLLRVFQYLASISGMRRKYEKQ